eukprot:scpid86150/ scgid14949/ Craniofacial development protein 2; p97 bucentaur protein
MLKLESEDLVRLLWGSHGRGIRNVNGQSLVDYCDSNGLYLANTTFQHAARHKTTWTGWRRDVVSGKTVPVFNQIDYIVCRSSHKRMLQNCRSYGGMEISTDHKLVVADLDLARIYGVLGACQPSSARHSTASTGLALNVSRLVEDKAMQKRYQERLSSIIPPVCDGARPCDEVYNDIVTTV